MLGEIDGVAAAAACRWYDGAFELRFVVDGEIAHAERALLRRVVGRRRFHRHRQLPAGHARINVGEAEERAGVGALQINQLAAVRPAAQIAGQRRVAADLGIEPETANFAGPARHFQIDAAQSFAVEADDGAKLHVEIDIDRPAFGIGFGGRGRRRRS